MAVFFNRFTLALQWRHNRRNGVSYHQRIDCLPVYSTVCSGEDQRKHQSSASLVFVRGIRRWPLNSPHKGSVTPKMFPSVDVVREKSNRATVYITVHEHSYPPYSCQLREDESERLWQARPATERSRDHCALGVPPWHDGIPAFN